MLSGKKNVKIKHTGYKRYYMHDNGERPFLVYIGKKDAFIYKRPENSEIDENDWSSKDDDNKWMYTKLIKHIKFSKAFIGKSPLNAMTKFSGGHGKRFNGNSILLRISKNMYIFIGERIFSFKSLDDIIKFVSPVGNNDVPYPYAVDKNNNCYLLLYDIIMKYKRNPYEYYFNVSNITRNLRTTSIRYPTYKKFHDIEKFYINKEQYILNYEPCPAKNYDRLIKVIGKPLSIVKTDGKRVVLTKKSYTKLMKDFGKEIGIKKIKGIKIIQKRIWYN